MEEERKEGWRKGRRKEGKKDNSTSIRYLK